jgi:hypothetical protein
MSTPHRRATPARSPARKASAKTRSTPRSPLLVAPENLVPEEPHEPLPADWVRPLSAQELHDEAMLQRKPRSAAQGKKDKALVERLLQRNARPSSPGSPAPIPSPASPTRDGG